MATQQHSFANPAPAGLGALAMACFTFYAMFTGKVSHDALPLLACWLVGGAICQLTCGLIELKDHNISGGNVFLFFGAFFMATDYPTSPMTKRGHIVFGVGCGVFTFVIRKFGGYPEGVCYAILIMNAAAPLIDRFTPPPRFGFKKAKQAKAI